MHLYTWKRFIVFSLFAGLLFCSNKKTAAQCPWGYPADLLIYDTSLITTSGNYETFLKIPKFDPTLGMLLEARLSVTMTGYVRMFLENNVGSGSTYDIDYDRRDSLSGPGLVPVLRNTRLKNYGPYNLAASDGMPFSGPDYRDIGPDTIMNAVTMTRSITSAALLDTFVGPSTDSLTYRYKIKAETTVNGSGDYLFVVATTGRITFRVEYIYCAAWILPVNLFDFSARKSSQRLVTLSWWSATDSVDSQYEVQVSRDGRNYSTAGHLPAHNNGGTTGYEYEYPVQSGDNGLVYFRIRHKYVTGHVQYSTVKSVWIEKGNVNEFYLYPNPSSGIVGIKFVNTEKEKYHLEIINATGQTVVNRIMEVSGAGYIPVAALQKGQYWVRLTNVTGHHTGVNQLFIK